MAAIPPGAPGAAAEPGRAFTDSTARAGAAAGSGVGLGALMASARALLRELPGLVSDRVELLSLELERAGRALVQIAMLIVAAAILGVTAWLALWSAAVGGLIALGLHWAVALLVVLLLNLVAAMMALQRARGLLVVIGLPATRRHLTLSPSADPPPPSDQPGSRKVPAPPAPNSTMGGAEVTP